MNEHPRDNLVRSALFRLEDVDAGDGLTLTGHAAVFNEWTEIDSWEGRFLERITPGAFRKTLQEKGDEVKLQFDHGQHPLIGSLPIGTISRLKEDDHGLFVEARLNESWLFDPVREAITNGSIDGMSFRFTVKKERWDKEETDLPERSISEVQLMEVGPVVWPAYKSTDVGLRTLEVARSLLTADTSSLGAAAGTPAVEAVLTHEPAPGHSRTYQPAQRPALTRERLTEDLRRITATTAAASARSA